MEYRSKKVYIFIFYQIILLKLKFNIYINLNFIHFCQKKLSAILNFKGQIMSRITLNRNIYCVHPHLCYATKQKKYSRKRLHWKQGTTLLWEWLDNKAYIITQMIQTGLWLPVFNEDHNHQFIKKELFTKKSISYIKLKEYSKEHH